ncbi:hypothetical protein GCM10028819_30400 [Spirosoma humi]
MASLFKQFLLITTLLTRKDATVTQRTRRTLVALTIILATGTGKPAFSQTFPLQIQVSVLPPYSAYLQDYPGAGQQVRVFLINTSRNTYQIRLSGQLTGDNGIEIRTSPNYRPPRPLTVPPGQTLVSRNDLEGLFDLNQIEVTGIDKNRLARGFPLPDGTYQLCVRAYNETATNTAATAFGQPLSAEFPLGCSAPILVRSVEPPILISPLCDAGVTATTPQAVVFTWTPPVGVSPAQVDYTVRIVELPQENVDPNVFIDAVALPKSGVEVRNVRTSTFLYGPTQPPLVVGKRYAWRVQAIDRSRKLNFLNDGKSPVCSFTYGGEGAIPAEKKPVAYVYKSGSIGATCSCKQTPTDQSVDNKPALSAGKATVAGFPLTFLKTADGVKEVDGVLTGNGTIPMPIVNNALFKLRVQLVNVQCNAAGEVISGYVQAIRTDDFPGIFPKASKPSVDPPGIPVISTANADSVGAQIQKLSEQMQAFPGHLLSQAGEVAKSVGMEVPFGIDKKLGPISTNIAITDVIFTPEDAYFNANTFIESPGLSAQFNGIPLAAYHVCIKPDGACGDKVLYLAKDMAASSLLTLKGGAVALKALQQNVTHVVFDENGFKTLHIAAGINTPGLLRKSDDQPMELLTKFDIPSSDAKDFKNWMAQVQADDDFYVKGLSDFVLSMKDKDGNPQPAIYDHDETQNPGVLPANYDPGKDPTWHGLYLPKLSISIPFLKSLNNGKEVPVGVDNMIYDSNGFTGDAVAGDEAHPLIALGNGNMSSWYCSADQLRLSFYESGFKSSSLVGKVVLPVCKVDDKAAPIPYTCTLSKPDGTLEAQFVLQPKNQIHTDVFGVADIALDSSSSITASYMSGSFKAAALLSGKISLTAGPLKMDLVKFQEMGLSTDKGFTIKSLSTASPQKFIAGLPFTIDTPKDQPIFSPRGNNQYSLNFVGGLDLSENMGLKGNVTANLIFSTGLLNGRPDWKYVDTDVTAVSVDGALGPISATGTVAFSKKEVDPTYGDGFRGDVTLIMPFGAFGLKGYFGNVNNFSYWGVAGEYVLPSGVPGIPLVPGVLFFRGFGGGVFSNMAKQNDGSFKPVAGELTFSAKAIVGTGDGTLLTATGDLTVGITKSTGDGGGCSVSYIQIDADAYLLSKPNAYKSAMATGKGLIKWDIAQGLFKADFSITAGYGSKGTVGLYATSEINLQVNPSAGKWYFSFGEPDGRVSTELWVANKRLFQTGSYFMTGNDLHGVILPPQPYGMDDATLKQLGYTDGDAARQAFETKVKSFLAFGVGYQLEPQKYSLGPFYVRFEGSLGFDALLAERSGCDEVAQNGQVGFNGWYANAQAYAYASISLGMHIDLWIYEGDLEVLSVSAGILLRGGLPNPIWFKGNGFFKYRALAGRIRGQANIEFWYNKDLKCAPSFEPPNPFTDQPLIARLGPGGADKVSTLSPFFVEFNYPMESMIDVDVIDPDGKEFRQRFRLRFKNGQRFNFAVTNNGGASGQLISCSADPNGKLVWKTNDAGDMNYVAYYYRNSALLPNADYTMTIGVEVWEYPVDKYYALPSSPTTAGIYMYPKTKQGVQPKPVEQTETLKFSTKDCVNTLTKDGPEPSVSFSYPFEGQRYFMKGGVGTSFIKLTATMCCGDKFNADPNYKLMARLTPYNGGTFDSKTDGLLAPVSARNTTSGAGVNLYEYAMPNAVKNKTLYKFELVRIPTDGYIAQLEKDARTKAKKAENWHVGGGNTQGVGALQGGLTLNGVTMPKTDYVGAPSGPMPTGMSSSQPGQNTTQQQVSFATLQKGIDVVAQTEQTNWSKTQAGFLMNENTLKESDMKAFNVKVGEGSEGDLTDYKQLYEQVLYSYYFKTSQFNTLADKLAATSLIPLKQNRWGSYAYQLPVSGPENFESFEVSITKLPNELKLPPFVRLGGVVGGKYFDDVILPAASQIPAVKQKVHVESVLPLNVDNIGSIYASALDDSDFPTLSAQDLADRMPTFAYPPGKGPEPPMSKATIDNFLSGSRPPTVIKK